MTTTRTIATNGIGEFFVITRFDGAFGYQVGPLSSGEDAAAEITLQEQCRALADDEAPDADDAFWQAAERRSADACNRHFGA